MADKKKCIDFSLPDELRVTYQLKIPKWVEVGLKKEAKVIGIPYDKYLSNFMDYAFMVDIKNIKKGVRKFIKSRKRRVMEWEKQKR